MRVVVYGFFFVYMLGILVGDRAVRRRKLFGNFYRHHAIVEGSFVS